MKRILSFVLMLFLSAGLAFAQNTITVTGTVVDEQNLPMIGVAVVQQGTSNGISTDIVGASIRAYLNALNKIVHEENG